MPEPASAVVTPGDRIPEFEGLRGWLAWWVVFHHLYFHAGVDNASRSKLEFWVAYGWGAVPLFIILSGYVIALLIETQRESYVAFIVRRFFRLGPVYYLLTAVAAVSVYGQHVYTPRQFLAHVVAHATMLHGLIPDEILKGSDGALLHPAWSISVEWQFYLVAPLVLWFCRGSAARALLVVAGCFVVSKALQSRYTFPNTATVFMRGGLFAVGIYSYYLTQFAAANARLVRPLVPSLLPLALTAAWVYRGETFGPAVFWAVILTAVLGRIVEAETPLTRPLARLMSFPAAVWLGKISYSTYLCHDLVFAALVRAFGPSFEANSPRTRCLTLLALGVPLTLGLSAALYHLVEKPGIRLGKTLVSRPKRPTLVARPAEPVAQGS